MCHCLLISSKERPCLHHNTRLILDNAKRKTKIRSKPTSLSLAWSWFTAEKQMLGSLIKLNMRLQGQVWALHMPAHCTPHGTYKEIIAKMYCRQVGLLIFLSYNNTRGKWIVFTSLKFEKNLQSIFYLLSHHLFRNIVLKKTSKKKKKNVYRLIV